MSISTLDEKFTSALFCGQKWMSMAVDLWSITGKNESIPPCDQLCLKVNWCIQTWLWVLTNHGNDRIHSFSWLAVWQGERMVHQCKSLTRVDKSLIGLDNCLQRLDKTPHIWSKYLIFWYKPTLFDQSREEDLSSFLWLVKIVTWWWHYTAGKRSCSKSFVFWESRSGNWKSRIQIVIASLVGNDKNWQSKTARMRK